MEKINLEQIKRIEMGILDEIVDACDILNIDYYLAYGTLLGAVRHKGFIPWDDDIDIWMWPKDIELLSDYLKNKKSPILIINNRTNSESIYSFPKAIDTRTSLIEKDYKSMSIMGIFVDIFPLSYAFDDRIKREKQKKRSLFWARLLDNKHKIKANYSNLKTNKKIIRFFGFAISKFISNSFIQKRLLKCESLCETKMVGVIWEAVFPVDFFIKGKKEAKYLLFENKYYRVPNNYLCILTDLYGDYLTLPPLEKRIASHRFDAYFK